MNKRDRMIRQMAESKAIHERGHFSSTDRVGVTQIVGFIELQRTVDSVVVKSSSDEVNTLNKILEQVNG